MRTLPIWNSSRYSNNSLAPHLRAGCLYSSSCRKGVFSETRSYSNAASLISKDDSIAASIDPSSSSILQGQGT
jgi:hypothetical protein